MSYGHTPARAALKKPACERLGVCSSATRASTSFHVLDAAYQAGTECAVCVSARVLRPCVSYATASVQETVPLDDEPVKAMEAFVAAISHPSDSMLSDIEANPMACRCHLGIVDAAIAAAHNKIAPPVRCSHALRSCSHIDFQCCA